MVVVLTSFATIYMHTFSISFISEVALDFTLHEYQSTKNTTGSTRLTWNTHYECCHIHCICTL